MNLSKVDYILKAWPTLYLLNELFRASLQFVLKKKMKISGLFKKKRLEKNNHNQNQCAGCKYYLTN